MLNANIRCVATHFDKPKFILDDLEYTFSINRITETLLKPINADFSLYKYNIMIIIYYLI